MYFLPTWETHQLVDQPDLVLRLEKNLNNIRDTWRQTWGIRHVNSQNSRQKDVYM